MTDQSQTINVNVNQLLIAFVAAMGIACAFVAFIINTSIESKVSALTSQQAATSTAAPQTNNAPGVACVEAADASHDAVVAGAGTAGAGGKVVNGANLKYAKYVPSNVTYNQSNTQTTVSTSTNNYTDNRWSGNTKSISKSSTNIQAWNNGNTKDSGNTTTTTTNTVNDNSNHSVNTTIQDNGNTYTDNRNSGNTTNTSTTTTTNTVNDNSDNSVNTNIQDNGNTTNSGNTAVLTALGVVVL